MRWLELSLAVTLVACSSAQDENVGSGVSETGGGGGSGGEQSTTTGTSGTGVTTSAGGTSSTGGASNTGGTTNTAGSRNTGGSAGTGGSNNTGGSSSMKDAGPLPADPCVEAGTCPLGVWTNVPPAGTAPTGLAPTAEALRPGAVVTDPAPPHD